MRRRQGARLNQSQLVVDTPSSLGPYGGGGAPGVGRLEGLNCGTRGYVAGGETCRRLSRGVRVPFLASRKNTAGVVVIESESLRRRRSSGRPELRAKGVG